MGENIEYYRILNLEGSWLTNSNKDFTYNTNNKKNTLNINKLYSATMPYSLETLRAFTKYPDEIFDIEDEKATKLFVNFKFSKDMVDTTEDDSVEVKIQKKKLRKFIYTSNIFIDGIQYCYFKRGASKARTANVIFIKKDCYDNLFNPCLLGLKIEDNQKYDITGLSAYISLIMSGIIGTIDIKPEEILIIKDIMSPTFKATQSLTKYNKKGEIEQFIDEYDINNNCTDGQVLLDESVYLENELIHVATCVLLRNDLFKGNACRTRLQEYYNVNHITKVWDLYRGWIDANNIKLVITPSACKYLKFADQFTDEKECFLNWLQNIPSTFGVVKTDGVGKYSFSNRLSYQMLNSMNIDRKTLEEEIMKDEVKYYKLLKDNTLVTSKELRGLSAKNKSYNREIRNDMAYFINHISLNNDEISTTNMLADLLNVNDNLRFTKLFKDWKKDQLKDYVKNLRLGKIRIKNSIYAIMVSCPYEMLVATTIKDNKIETNTMNGWEMYCPNFEEASELLVIRNPQINAGNIGCYKNKWHNEFKWFGYCIEGKPMYKFVTFINTWDVDTMNRLQGCDFDIDTCFLSNNSSLVEYARKSQDWATPTNGIKGEIDYKEYNLDSLANLDNYLGGSTRLIGQIVNKSAIFNAYMYNGINNNFNEDFIKKCYDASSLLSSFSQIAIDMAKKSFKGLSLINQMRLLNKIIYVNDIGQSEYILKYNYDYDKKEEVEIKEFIRDYRNCLVNNKYKAQYKLVNKDDFNLINNLMHEWDNIADKIPQYLEIKLSKKIKVYKYKMIVPYFFKYTAKNNNYRIPTKMDCTMDYLEDILDNLDTKAMKTDSMNPKELIVLQKELDGKSFNRNKIDKARMIIDNCQSILDKNYYEKNDNEKEKEYKTRLRKWAKKKAVKELVQLKLNEKTIHRVLLRAFNIDNKYEGKVLEKTDNKGNLLTFYDWDYDEEFLITVRELKEMSMLALSLIYEAYPIGIKKCFIKKQSKLSNIEPFWV